MNEVQRCRVSERELLCSNDRENALGDGEVVRLGAVGRKGRDRSSDGECSVCTSLCAQAHGP